MEGVTGWIRRRQSTLSLAIFFAAWYVLQLSILQLFGERIAIWWFYFEAPPNAVSPGILLAPLSHDMSRLTHIGSNLLMLVIAGGLAEPYVGKERILVSVVGLGYLGTYLANVTIFFHSKWMVAGASGGILALWAYAGLRMRHRVTDSIPDGLKWSRKGIETIGATFLLLSIPAFLLHQTLWIDQPHSGHVIGLVLGCSYYVIRSCTFQISLSH